MKKKGGKGLWGKIKFKYKVRVINENRVEEVIGIDVWKVKGFWVLVGGCRVMFVLGGMIIVFSGLGNYLGGYMKSEVGWEVVSNGVKGEWLVEGVEGEKGYMMKIEDILRGKVDVDRVEWIEWVSRMGREEVMKGWKEEDDFGGK